LAVGSDGRVHIAWVEIDTFDIVYTRFRPGWTWPSPKVVATAKIPLPPTDPSIGVASDGTVHIVWCEYDTGTNTLLGYRRYEPGTGWTDIEYLSGWDVYDPSLAVGPDGTAHIAWQWVWEDQIAILYRKCLPDTG
jgi:hypothetical protein